MQGGNRITSWVRTHPVRTGFYGALAALFLAVVLSFSSPQILSKLVTWLARRPLFHRQMEQVGLRYSVQIVRLRFPQTRTPLGIELEDLGLEFVSCPLVARVRRIEVSTRRGLEAEKIKAGTREVTDLIQLEALSLDPAAKKAFVRNVSIPLGSGRSNSGVSVREVAVQGFEIRANSTGPIAIENVIVKGVGTDLVRGPDGTWESSRARILLKLLQDFPKRPPISIVALARLLAQYRSVLWWTILIVSVLLLLLKGFATLPGSGPKLRTSVAVSAVLLPIICYRVLFHPVALTRFFVLSLLASFALACFLEVVLYRKKRAWHARWEPFALDVLSPVILLPLLCARGVLPPSLTLPDGLRVAEARFREVRTVARLNGAGATNVVRLSAPLIAVDDFALGANHALPDAWTTEFRRARLQAELEADFSAELGRIHYLPEDWRGPQRATLCADVYGFPSGTRPTLSAGLSGVPCANERSKGPEVQVLAAASILPA